MNSTSLYAPRVHDEEIVADLRRVATLLRRAPSMSAYAKHGRYALETVKRRWGSWRMAMKHAGLRCRRVGTRYLWPRRERAPSTKRTDQRSCLRCGHHFTSCGPHNRICLTCVAMPEDEDA